MSDLDDFFNEAVAEDAGVSEDTVDDVEVDEVSDPDPLDIPEDVEQGEESDPESDDLDVEDMARDAEDVWNWSDYADREIPIKYDGQEMNVSLSELRDGYMMRKDYTAKTQEIAEARRAAQWAEEVIDAFDRDALGTLEAFARAYGLLDDKGQAVQEPRFDELDEDIRPWAEKATHAEQQLHMMEQRMVQLEQERLKSEIKLELDMLANRFGDSFDKVEVLQLAAQKNLPLEDAYYRLMGERQFQQSQSQSAAEAQAASAAQAEQQKVEAARQAKKAKAASASKGSFKASDIPADDFDDIGELFEQLLAGS